MPKELFDAIDNHALNEDTCFLCGAALTSAIRSDEHVFPMWLQHRFDLWDNRLHLLNGTAIPYRRLTVPCCTECNNEHLSALENRIRSSVFEPNDSGSTPNTHDLYLWVAKILFGIMYRELLLPLDRSSPEGPKILDPEAMQHFRMLHFFLQSVRVPMRFHCQNVTFPASVLVYDLQCPTTKHAQFDFRDNPIYQTIFLRLGSKGIIAAFDSGAQDYILGDLFRREAKHCLHPIQFEELAAKLFYKASLLKRFPFYLISEFEGVYDVTLLHEPTFNKWNQDDYARLVAVFTDHPLEFVNPQPGMVISWLSDERDEFYPIDIRSSPWRGAP
jgi:hypothetical protein